MNPPQNLPEQMADKTTDELSAMFKSPHDWLPEALDAAKAELLRRGIDASTIPVVGPPPIPEGTPVFFPVSALKLVVMSIVTFGVYELYWFYRNWKLVKQRTSRDIMPFWRAFFAFFFCYSLFREVRDSATLRSTSVGFSPGLLTLVWIGLTMCWRLPDPYWLVDTLAVLALLPVQQTVNELNATAAPGHDLNARFSGWNIAGIVVGGLFFVFAIIGTFLPE